MKIKSISLMSVFMCFCVVLIHLTSFPVMEFEKGTSLYNVIYTINMFLRFAVPCFVFLSGYKLYNRYENEKIDLKKFYFGRIKKIVIPYLLSYTIYFMYFYMKNWVKENDYLLGLCTRKYSSTFLLYYLHDSTLFTIPTNNKNIYKTSKGYISSIRIKHNFIKSVLEL